MTNSEKPQLTSNLSDVSLPCPFCGGVPAFVKEGSTFRWRVMECQSCGARCGEVRVQTVGEGTPKDWEEQVVPKAIAEWNKRHTIETLAVDHPAHATAAEVADCRICTPHRKWPGEPPHCPTCDCPTPKAGEQS